MLIIRVLLISVLAAFAGAIGGVLLAGGTVHQLGPAMFVSYFTLMGSLGLLAPAYGIMKIAEVPLLRRYAGVVALGALAGAIILLPMDFATGHFDAAPLGAWFGAITGISWMIFHAASRALTRGDQGA